MAPEDRRSLEDSATRWLDRHYGFACRARLMEDHGGRASPHWLDFAAMGWLALPLPETAGGLGGDVADLAPLMRAFGRALVVEPFLPTILLGAALLAQAGDARAAQAADGALQLAAAVEEEGRAARTDDGGWRLDGCWPCVPNGDAAGLVLIAARAETTALFAVPPGTPGLLATGYRCQDGHRAAEIRLDGCVLPPASRLGVDADALDRVTQRAVAALLQEAVGAMEAAIARSIAHLKARRQFGRALADFQVLRHRVVDMWIAAEEARSMADYAAEASAWTDAWARGRAVSAAKARVSQAGRFVGQQAIHLHGAIGLAEEHPIGHYAKRLEAIGTLFGDAEHHLGKLTG